MSNNTMTTKYDNEPFMSVVMNPRYWEDQVLSHSTNDAMDIDYNGCDEEALLKDIGDRVSITLTRDYNRTETFIAILEIVREEFEEYGVEITYETVECVECGCSMPFHVWDEDPECESCGKELDHWGGIVEDEEDESALEEVFASMVVKEPCNRCKTTTGDTNHEDQGVCKNCYEIRCG